MSDVDDLVERLLRELDNEELEATVVRIDRAVTTGRQRVRRRRLVTASGVGIAVVAAAAAIGIPAAMRKSPASNPAPNSAAVLPSGVHRSVSPSSPPPTRPVSPPPAASCTGQRLTLPAGATSGVVTGGDPTGRYLVGYVFGHGLAYGTVLWTDGTPKLINAPADDERITVNSNGEVAGSGLDVHDNVDEQVSWTYRNGTVTRLGDADYSYRVYAVNENGDLLVQRTSRYLDHVSGSTSPIVLQVLGHDGSTRQLSGPGSDNVRFVGDIDDDGTVVGGSGGSGIATVWRPDGTTERLHSGDQPTFANRIQDGWVLGGNVGTVVPFHTEGLPLVRWDLRSGKLIPSKLFAAGWDINRYGWIVGTSTEHRPAAEEDDQVIPLPLPPGTADGVGFVATTISDNGHTIGGQANLTNGDIVPVRWLCH